MRRVPPPYVSYVTACRRVTYALVRCSLHALIVDVSRIR